MIRRKLKYILILAILLVMGGFIFTSCTSYDAITETPFYAHDIYTWNGTAYQRVAAGGVIAEVDPIFIVSPAFGITALNIAAWNGHPALTTGTHGVTGTIVGTSDVQALTNKQITMNNGDIIYWKDAGGVSRGILFLGGGTFHLENPTGNGLSFNYGVPGSIYLWGSHYGTGEVLVLYGSNNATAAETTRDSPSAEWEAFYWDGGAAAGWPYNVLHDMISSGATPSSQAVHSINGVNILRLYNNNGLPIVYTDGSLHLRTGTATANTSPIKFTAGTLMTNPESGAFEYDGTGFYYTDSNLVRKTLHRTDYAGAYFHENAVVQTIEEANTTHAVHGWTQDGLSANWTFYAGKSLSITAWANNGDGKTRVTCAGHGLANNDIVTIANTTSYDGIYKIEQVAAATFVIQKVWVADEGAKTGHAAGYVTNTITSSTGVYLACNMVSVTPATALEVLEFEFYLDTTEMMNTESQTKLGNVGDYSSAGSQGIISYTAGQKLWLKVENLTDAGDLTIRDGTMVMTRIN